MTGLVPTHSRARVILLLSLTFSAGVAIGVAGSRLVAADDTTGQAAEQAASRSDAGDRTDTGDRREARFAIERYADELGLTSEQRERIAPILKRTREDLSAIVSEVRPRYRAVYESARAEIEAVLTPEQTEKYREIVESRRRGAGEHDRGPHGPEGTKEGRE